MSSLIFIILWYNQLKDTFNELLFACENWAKNMGCTEFASNPEMCYIKIKVFVLKGESNELYLLS